MSLRNSRPKVRIYFLNYLVCLVLRLSLEKTADIFVSTGPHSGDSASQAALALALSLIIYNSYNVKRKIK